MDCFKWSIPCESRLSRVARHMKWTSLCVRAIVPAIASELPKQAVSNWDSALLRREGGASSSGHVRVDEARGNSATQNIGIGSGIDHSHQVQHSFWKTVWALNVDGLSGSTHVLSHVVAKLIPSYFRACQEFLHFLCLNLNILGSCTGTNVDNSSELLVEQRHNGITHVFSPVNICLHDLFVSAPADTRVVDKCIQKLSVQVCFNLDHSFLNRFLITHIELDHLY